MFNRKKINDLETRVVLIGEKLMNLDRENEKNNITIKELERKVLLLKSDISLLNDKIRQLEPEKVSSNFEPDCAEETVVKKSKKGKRKK
jgi:hypothetical protein